MLPPLVSSQNRYHYRRPQERTIPRCKTELYNKSFVPSTTRLWNSLPDNVKLTTSLSHFKKLISFSDIVIPKYFYYGERNEQVIHCRLRMGMSDLKNDLYNRHLTDNPTCNCGYPTETAQHYLLYCPIYNDIRASSIYNLHHSLTDVETLLKGQPTLSLNENMAIFAVVHDYIKTSGRF